MNIHHVLQTCTMITGGGGIPPLVAHAYAVYTRRFFLPSLHPLLAPGYEANSITTLFKYCTADKFWSVMNGLKFMFLVNYTKLNVIARLLTAMGSLLKGG